MPLYRTFATQEEIDREYDVEQMVPDFRIFARQFIEGSARARAELAIRPDVRFGPTLDEYVDLFLPVRKAAPIFVFIHGGYWRMLSAKEFGLVAPGPVARGFAVAVSNYALCPKVRIEEITRQSRATIAWLYRHAREFDADPERIFVAGHSAGGQQVGMLLATDWAGEYGLPPDIIKGAIAISGLFDLTPLRYSWLQPKLLLDHETIARQSPQFNLPRMAPPLILSVGEAESAEFHRQSRSYMEAMRARGLRVEWLDQPGCNHFTAITGFAERDSILCRALGALADVPESALDVRQAIAPLRDRPPANRLPPDFRTFGPVA
jgi:arylformamidase